MSDPWTLLGERKILDDEIRAALVAQFGTRGKKALDAIDHHLVKKYLDFFVVTGSSGDYVISEGVCTCPDFAFPAETLLAPYRRQDCRGNRDIRDRRYMVPGDLERVTGRTLPVGSARFQKRYTDTGKIQNFPGTGLPECHPCVVCRDAVSPQDDIYGASLFEPFASGRDTDKPVAPDKGIEQA